MRKITIGVKIIRFRSAKQKAKIINRMPSSRKLMEFIRKRNIYSRDGASLAVRKSKAVPSEGSHDSYQSKSKAQTTLVRDFKIFKNFRKGRSIGRGRRTKTKKRALRRRLNLMNPLKYR